MKAFIDYFWHNQGFIYDPTKPMMLGRYHLEMMIIMLVLFIVIGLIGKKYKNKKRFLSLIACVLLVLEILRFLCLYQGLDNTLLDSVTLHMCTVAVIFTILTGFFQKQFFFDLMYILALTGGFTAIIIPFGILPWWNEFSFIPLQSNLSHMLMILFTFYAVKNKLFIIRTKRIYIGATGLIVMAALIHQFNLYKLSVSPSSFSNFFWTRYPDPLFPIINNLQFPYHIIILISLIIFSGLIFYMIGERLTKNKK